MNSTDFIFMKRVKNQVFSMLWVEEDVGSM